MLTKEQAQAIFDRLDEADLDVSLRKHVDRVDITTHGDVARGQDPRYAKASRYEVLVENAALDSADVLRLIADQVAKYEDAVMRPEIDGLVIR